LELMDTFKGYNGEWTNKMCPLDETYLAVGFKSATHKLGKQITIINGNTSLLLNKLTGQSADVSALTRIDNKTLAEDREI
jgi:hypothetical protein